MTRCKIHLTLLISNIFKNYISLNYFVSDQSEYVVPNLVLVSSTKVIEPGSQYLNV